MMAFGVFDGDDPYRRFYNAVVFCQRAHECSISVAFATTPLDAKRISAPTWKVVLSLHCGVPEIDDGARLVTKLVVYRVSHHSASCAYRRTPCQRWAAMICGACEDLRVM